MNAAAREGVLILGHPRSGTTLLRRLVDRHPAFAAPPETHLFGACARFLAADLTAHGVDMGVLAGLDFAGFEDEVVLERLRAFAFSFLEDYAERAGKPRWAEKSAFDIFDLAPIERLCADRVRYVGIVRHPFDVAASCKEFCDAAGVYPAPMHAYLCRFSQPVEAFLHSWADTTRALVDLGRRRPERCIVCRYEDLVAAPEEVLGQIFAFLGEAPLPALPALDADETLGFVDHKGFGAEQIYADSVARWRSIPTPQLARLLPVVAGLMQDLGYDLPDLPPPPDTAEARRRFVAGLAAGRASRGKGGTGSA